jgi:hypothetical protein
MRDLETVLQEYGSESESYYAALANLARDTPFYQDRGEVVCGVPDFCNWLLRNNALIRPTLTFETIFATLPLEHAERCQLKMTTNTADELLARSILSDRDAVAPEWYAWFSDICNADVLDRIAERHVQKIPRQDLYDFMQAARSYIAEIACLVAGVDRRFGRAHAHPIAAIVNYMDGRANTLMDALRAAAGIRYIANEISSHAWDDHPLPSPLHADISNRTMFLVTAHESSAYLIATACLILKKALDTTARNAVRAAADFDFPIQSVLREAAEDLTWKDFRLRKGQRIRIHIGAAFGGGHYPNRSFGIGANACPGAKLALAASEAFVNNIRPLLPHTTFFEQSRHTTLVTRTFRRLNASTNVIA